MHRHERAELYGMLAFGILGFILCVCFLEKWSAIVIYTIAAMGIGRYVGGFISLPRGSSTPASSTCLRCGGAGSITAQDYPLVGFRCAKCKHHWTKRTRT